MLKYVGQTRSTIAVENYLKLFLIYDLMRMLELFNNSFQVVDPYG
jgi:hypothetical protein